MTKTKQTHTTTPATKRSHVLKRKTTSTTPDSISLEALDTYRTTREDIKTAALVVSGTVNLFVLIAWMTLQVTTQYDLQIATFLFVR